MPESWAIPYKYNKFSVKARVMSEPNRYQLYAFFRLYQKYTCTSFLRINFYFTHCQ